MLQFYWWQFVNLSWGALDADLNVTYLTTTTHANSVCF